MGSLGQLQALMWCWVGKEPKREGKQIAGKFLGLEGLPAVWCSPPIKTNPQSSWVPTKLDLYKSKVGVLFFYLRCIMLFFGPVLWSEWVYTDAFPPCSSQIMYIASNDTPSSCPLHSSHSRAGSRPVLYLAFLYMTFDSVCILAQRVHLPLNIFVYVYMHIPICISVCSFSKFSLRR